MTETLQEIGIELATTRMPEAAQETFRSLTRDRPRGGNPHPPMLANRYVSGSQTIKKTCVELAGLVAGTLTDESDPHWGEGGNSLADINLVHVPYGENEAKVMVPLSQDENGVPWFFVIHADGLVLQDATGAVVTPDDAPSKNHLIGPTYITEAYMGTNLGSYWLSIEEHKAPIFTYDEDRWDIARRQARCFLAAVMRMHQAGHRQLNPAGYLPVDDRRKRVMPLPESLLPGAINLICAPYSAEREERLEVPTPEELTFELDRCLAKAGAAIKTALGQDLDAAARWDREHADEFLWRRTEKVPADKDEAHAVIHGLLLAHRLLQPQPDQGKAAREKARDRVKALIAKHGLPQELDFSSGVGYRLNAKGNFSSVGTLPPELAGEASAIAIRLMPKGVDA